ncbi:hypothetical protein HN873_071071, partial [Arachis hypogaea]
TIIMASLDFPLSVGHGFLLSDDCTFYWQDLNELPLEAETVERGYSLAELAGMPKIHGLPTSSMYSSGDYYSASPNNQKFKKSSHSWELISSLDSNGSRGSYM